MYIHKNVSQSWDKNEILPFGAAWKDQEVIMLMQCQTEIREI